MFKELLSLFKSSDAIAQMGRDFERMLAEAHDLTLRSGLIFFDEGARDDEHMEISKRDVAINKLERSIRRQVITHLTLASNPRDVPYCLLLMSIVKDVERVGDYAKNVSEVRHDGGAAIPDDAYGKELRDLRSIVEDTFTKARHVFISSDSAAAIALIERGRAVNRRCDALIAQVARSGHDAATTTSLVLGARYYKRIGSHVGNMLSGIVMPLHKLDYFDEDQLDLVPHSDEDEDD